MTQFFLNELSLHGQYVSLVSFVSALRLAMEARHNINQAGFQLFCDWRIRVRPVIGKETFEEAVRESGNKDLIRQVLLWLSKAGPFWIEQQKHSQNDLFGLGNDDVTGSTLAEAACLHDSEIASRLFSFSPSRLNYNPLIVAWARNTGGEVNVPIENLWDLRSLEAALRSAERPLESWTQLRDWARRSCNNLILSAELIDPILNEPFSHAAAREIQMLLRILNEISACHDAAGALNTRGHELLRNYFQGHHARFTDESPNAKFSFIHPTRGDAVICSWHGKVRFGLQYRIHFEWPKPRGSSLWVSYIGPKLTKQ